MDRNATRARSTTTKSPSMPRPPSRSGPRPAGRDRREGPRVQRRPEGRVMAAHGLAGPRFGVGGLDPCPPFQADPLMPYTLWSAVLHQLPQVTFKPVERAFVTRTLPQSAEELAVVGHAAGIGEA